MSFLEELFGSKETSKAAPVDLKKLPGKKVPAGAEKDSALSGAGAAGIQAAASLAGGLMAAKAAAKNKEREMLMQGNQAQAQAGRDAAGQLSQGTNNAFAQMMQFYGGLRRG